MAGHEWFHGTRRGFTRGGLLLPRSQHGKAASTAPLQPGKEAVADAADWVYLTRNVDLAWAYAWAAPGRGRPKVLQVIPHGPLEPDDEHSPQMDAWRCAWAKVANVHTHPTITEVEATAGWIVNGRPA